MATPPSKESSSTEQLKSTQAPNSTASEDKTIAVAYIPVADFLKLIEEMKNNIYWTEELLRLEAAPMDVLERVRNIDLVDLKKTVEMMERHVENIEYMRNRAVDQDDGDAAKKDVATG